MPPPHVQVILGANEIPEHLKSALRRSGATASFRPLAEVLRSGITPNADAVVVVAPEDTRDVQTHLRVLLDRMAERPRATLVMKAAGQTIPRFAHPPTVPVAFGCGMSEDELSIRLTTMLEMRHSLDTLHREARQARHDDELIARQFASQLRLASRVQREFLPGALPAFGPVSFATLYRPADFVSGDIYDVQRLDEEHVGIAVADATGQGIPAALLTVFVKRALRGKEIRNGGYRVLRPDQVLMRLNEDLLEANLSECRFVACVYAVLNIRTWRLAVARGGAPYPLIRRASGSIESLRTPGGVVGVLPNTVFAVEEVQLGRGDAMVFHTDGLERLVAPQVHTQATASAFREIAAVLSTGPARATPSRTSIAAVEEDRPTRHRRTRAPRLLEAEQKPVSEPNEPDADVASPEGRLTPPDDWLTSCAWLATLRDDGVDIAFDQLLVRYDALRRIGHVMDDLTLVAVKIDP